MARNVLTVTHLFLAVPAKVRVVKVMAGSRLTLSIFLR
jgi:hypothetical protein